MIAVVSLQPVDPDMAKARCELPDRFFVTRPLLDVERDLIDEASSTFEIHVAKHSVAPALPCLVQELALSFAKLDGALTFELAAFELALHDDELAARIALGHELVTENEHLRERHLGGGVAVKTGVPIGRI